MSTRKSARFVVTALCCIATGAWATEYGTVVSSTPVVVAGTVPQRQCWDEPVAYTQRSNSGGGALVGAVIGAAVGNAFGRGAGRAAATGVGMIAGAAIGNQAEASNSAPPAASAQRCRDVPQEQARTVGYDVVYDYQGVRRSARLAQDPGDRIALEVSVTPVGAIAPGRTTRARPPAAPVYRSPSDLPYDDEGPPPPPARMRYAPPQPMVYAPEPVMYAPQPVMYVNPLPYVVIDGGWVGGHRHRR